MRARRRLRRLLAALAGWVAIGTYLVMEWARPIDEQEDPWQQPK